MKWESMENYLDSLGENHGIPGGEIQIYQNGELLYSHLFGDRVSAEGAEKNLYWLYSMTKLYTAVAAMQLVEQKKIYLDQPVTDFFPKLSEIIKTDASGRSISIEKMTVRRLLSMTGGLNYEIDGPALAKIYAEYGDQEKNSRGEEKIDRVMQAIVAHALEYEPGTHYKYSLCHDIMGAVIQKASGLPLDEYMQEYIFKPLAICDMGFYPTDEQKSRIARQYLAQEAKEGGTRMVRAGEDNYLINFGKFASGGAGIFANLTEYMRLPNALCQAAATGTENQILRPETIELMRTNQLTEPGLLQDFRNHFQNHGLEGFGYGLGVRTRIEETGSSPVGEFGWDGAAGGYVLIDPKNRLTVGYVQHVLQYGRVYGEIHPQIRKLVYETIMTGEER